MTPRLAFRKYWATPNGATKIREFYAKKKRLFLQMVVAWNWHFSFFYLQSSYISEWIVRKSSMPALKAFPELFFNTVYMFTGSVFSWAKFMLEIMKFYTIFILYHLEANIWLAPFIETHTRFAKRICVSQENICFERIFVKRICVSSKRKNISPAGFVKGYFTESCTQSISLFQLK